MSAITKQMRARKPLGLLSSRKYERKEQHEQHRQGQRQPKKAKLYVRFARLFVGGISCLSAWNIYLGTNPNPGTTTTKSDPNIYLGTNPNPGATTTKSDPSLWITPRTPTNHACDNVNGVYHIAMGDIGGAAGTIFFQFVLGQALYAERHNLKPWVHLDSVSYVVYDPLIHGQGPGVDITAWAGRNATRVVPNNRWHHFRDVRPGPPNSDASTQQQTLHFAGTGVWQHYFEDISDFVPGDTSCQDKLYVTMDLKLITPGIHGFADWAPKCWRYKYLPDYITKPHIPLTEWLEPNRIKGAAAVKKYLHFRPYLREAAERANPGCSLQNACLSLHIRHSDKAAGRRVIAVSEFLPYATAFLRAGGKHIYLATDSTAVLQQIRGQWPEYVQNRIRTIGDHIVRSSDDKAVFDIAADRHHRTNKEVLIEILALSQSQFMIHGLSAVTESSIWINLKLHFTSVNLEDPERLTPVAFAALVQQVLRKEPLEHWPRPYRTDPWWMESMPTSTAATSAAAMKQQEREVHSSYFSSPVEQTSNIATVPNTACDGFDGILRISAVGKTAAAPTAFFTAVLNQLIYADFYNLKPWVDLREEYASVIFDESFHGKNKSSSDGGPATPVKYFEMLNGMRVTTAGRNTTNGQQIFYPSRPAVQTALKTKRFLVPESSSNGIWNSYFKEVSDFLPGDSSCRNKPLVDMNELQVVPGLYAYSPFSVRAWKYDTVPDHLWKPNRKLLTEWLDPMRRKAHEIIKKYYRFQPYLVRRAAKVNPVRHDDPSKFCLAVHFRNGVKKGKSRTKVNPNTFQPYIEAFVRATRDVLGDNDHDASDHKAWMYVSTDSHKTLRFIEKNFDANLTERMKTAGPYVVRSSGANKEWPSHLLEDHHRVNSEVLVDILAMSKCQFILHGHSTVSEAAIYINYPVLHNNSVNMEDPDKLTPQQFEGKVRQYALASTATTEVANILPQIGRARINNATILQKVVNQQRRKCKTNAIVYLAQKKHSTYIGQDSYGNLLKSLTLLKKNYLSIDNHDNNLDIFIFHVGEFNTTDLENIETHLGSSFPGIINLVDLQSSSYWARPPHHAKDNPETWYAYKLFGEGYRRMMHWYAIDIWKFFKDWNARSGCKYRYLWRLDEDSYILSKINYDVFNMMKSNQYVYGYRMCSYEMQVAQRMWKLYGNKRDFHPIRQLDLEMCGFYNNFFVADLHFFTKPTVADFLRFVDRQGQIYRRRLGDLMIHTMAVTAFAPAEKIHRFLDFTYQHATVNQTSGCVTWGGIQAGYNDELAPETLQNFYQDMALDRECPLTTTSYLRLPALSPTYAHITDPRKAKDIALLTVTAGNVELSNKGILSG